MKGQNFPISILKIRLVEFPKHILATYIKSEMPNFKDFPTSRKSDNLPKTKNRFAII